jgi:hypothetical protein
MTTTTAQSEIESPHAAIEFSATMVDITLSKNEQSDAIALRERSAEKDELLVELQSSLDDHMTHQVEAENRARQADDRIKLL